MLNRPTITLIGFNFLYYVMLSIFISYLPVYFSERGISPAEIGILLGVGTVVGIFAPPLWGYISDKWQNVKKALLLTVAASTLVGTVLFEFSSFLMFFIFVGLMYFFMSPIGPLTDSLNYRVAEEHGVSFGSIRLFGSIGYGTSALVIGILLERWGMETLSYLFLGSGVLTLAIGLLLPKQSAASKPVTFGAIKKFFSYRPTLWLLFMIMLLSIPHRTNDSFVGVYIQNLGGSTTLVGQAWFYATISEAVSFALAVFWLRKGKELQLMAVSAAFYAVRFYLCSVMSDPHWIAWLQLFHAITFVIFYSASIQYLYRTAPDELKATTQTVFAGIFFGLSGIIGSVLGGWIFGLMGGQALYKAMAILSAFTFVLIGLTLMRNRIASPSASS
jgi:PPP family 3-phenylpropionic acid transporter